MDEQPAATTMTLDLPGEGTFVVPCEAIALDRANYMARQAAGNPGPGNDQYDDVLENELQFALGRTDIMADWVRHHMRRSAILPYRATG